MKLQVLKRDGRKVAYDGEKIINAISKAMKYGSGIYRPKVAEKVEQDIYNIIQTTKSLSIFQIEDMVYHKLIEYGEVETAKAYEGYRAIQAYKREQNTSDDEILGLLDYTNEEVMKENSNKDPILISTQRDLIAGEVSKDIARRKLIPSHLVQAHDEGKIHIHK